MVAERRYVLDTNVIISALLFEESTPGRAFRAALRTGEVLLSAEVLLELNNLLGSGKFDGYVTSQERDAFLRSLLQEARLVEVQCSLHACRDPKDDKLLELAIDGKASCIVSGDDDLLTLREFQGVPILTAADFLRSLEP